MLNVAGKVYFAKNQKELTASLFNKGGTANGTYKKLKAGRLVQFFTPQGDIFAAWINNRHGERFFVSAARLGNGRTYYLNGLSDRARERLGLAGYGYAEESGIANTLQDRLPAI